MERRPPNTRHKPLQAKDALDLLIKAAGTLKLLGSLSVRQASCVKDAVEILRTAQASEKRKKYKLFLSGLLSSSGHHMVLLCAVALGQARVVHMKDDDRTSLAHQMEAHSDLDHPTLRSLAKIHTIPESVNDIISLLNVVEQSRKRKRGSTDAQDELPIAQTGRQIQFMFSKAPIRQIALLGELLPNAIQSSRQWEAERKAGELTTDCLTTMIPEDQNEDISITIWVGQRAGLRMRDMLKLQPTWSSSLGHLSP